ncbi:MAG: response regulator [Pseudohongiella sp.]|nr:response regulator [Pseudohongiella sp.]
MELTDKQSLKLLVIDDDERVTEFIEHVVEGYDISVLSINDSKLVESSCKSFEPDAIFMGLALPGFCGANVLHYLSVLECKAKIYLISGQDQMALDSCQALGQRLDLNTVGALIKPFSIGDVHQALAV